MKATDTTERLGEYLKVMGIQSWVRRSQSSLTEEIEIAEIVPRQDYHQEDESLRTKAVQPGIALEEVPLDDVAQLDWSKLKEKVASCTACALHESRTNTVFGVGNHHAQVMVIGEAPGADEDQQGEPFVGRAGKLLNNMLLAIGYKREQVYIANILKCRPPGNRDPQPEEVAQCEHFLKRQVELIQPKVILAVGRIAAHNLMKVETPIGRMRGKLHHYGETPVVVTYHPAYLLRKPSEKAKAWDDLCFALETIRGNTD